MSLLSSLPALDRGILKRYKMRAMIITILFIYAKCDDNYYEKRHQLIELELKTALGGKTILSDKENAVNDCLMRLKFNELDYGYNNPENFNLSHHFFDYKDSIRKSKVYKIIKSMPKGGVLHVHEMALLGPDYLVNITYMDHLYVCFENNIRFVFSNNVPNVSCESNWQLMSEARWASGNVSQFDAYIRKQFTLVVENPYLVYHSVQVWNRFRKYFDSVHYLITYRPNWEKYTYDVLKSFRNDNVMYIEARSSFPELYELNGTTYDKQMTAKVYKETIQKFVNDYPDFVGAKLIFASSRRVDKPTLDEYIKEARQIKKDMPDLLAGLDLVGQEDIGNPLLEFVPQLLAVKDLTFFFHAGETNWYGTLIDENLVDAILLGAKRIGHGYALAKHPVLIKEVIRNNICLEVSVVSNSVLSLVKDVRNHPLNIFLSSNLPVVLSSDDPGAWEADPLSDDFYVAFVGVASRLSDLKMLKTLAINSLKYSALEVADKDRALEMFRVKWNDFINNFNCNSY